MDPFLQACRNHGLILDANVLNIFIVGMKDKNMIPDVPSTKNYQAEDFDNICKLFDYSKAIILSPYILPETSNTLPLDYKSKNTSSKQCSPFLEKALLLLKMDNIKEEYEPFKKVIENNIFYKFGITDTAIIDLATKSGYAVLSNDGPLVGFLQNTNCQVKNLNHLRAQRLLAS